MRIRQILLYLVVFFIPHLANASPSVGSPVSSTTAIINKIINGTPGMNTITTTGTGVGITATGETAVVGRGLTIPIAATAETTITAGRLAGVAAKAIRYGGWVGIAAVVIPWIADKYGIKVCPPPDFFCMPGPDVPVKPVSGGWTSTVGGKTLFFSSVADGCDALLKEQGKENAAYYGTPVPVRANANVDSPYDCYIPKAGFSIGRIYNTPATCPDGSTKASDGATCGTSGPTVPAGDNLGPAIEGAVTGDAGRMGNLYGKMAGSNMPMFAPGDHVDVTAPPLVSPQPETSTQTVQKPDGSVDTVKTDTKIEVKPVVTGDTLGSAKIDYPTTTTTTTTTTNNVTHITTTVTNVTNNYGAPAGNTVDAPVAPPKPVTLPNSPGDLNQGNDDKLEIPDDYNREVTQQSILQKITEFMKPITAEVPSGDKELESVDKKIGEGTTAIGGISEGSVGLTGWFPKVPTTACRDPKVPNAIGSGETAVPICDSVNTFSRFISAVICVFALFGCVREVQAALKA